MFSWNAQQYLKFENQRTQPAIDLAKRINIDSPKSILDIGCGPGNSTAVLKSIFPESDILGIDNSPDMLNKARQNYPELKFKLSDTDGINEKYDVIFSNACLQWIPNHKKLLPELMGKLNDGGVLAVQVPINGTEPFFEVISEVVSNTEWGFDKGCIEANKTLSSNEYFDILSECSDNFDIWETVYYHHMPDIQAILEWVRGTRLRPYLNVLDDETAALFEKEIMDKAEKFYPKQKNGEIIFRFRRLFFTANK